MPKSVLFVLLALVLAISAPLAAKPVLNQATAAHVRPAIALAASTIIPSTTLALRVDTPDGPLDLLLTPATQMQAQAAPMVSAIRDGRTRLYRGKVAGRPSSWVRMSRIDGAWLGAIQVEGKLWLMDPARQHPQLATRLGLGRQDSLVFTMDDFQGLGPMDFGGVMPPAGALTQPMAAIGAKTSAQTSTTRFLGVTLVLDTEFQSHYGANTQSTAVAILNIVDGFYSSQVNTEVYLYALKSLASNGTLTSTNPETLLNAFSTYSKSSIPFSGVAHLLSGKNFDGSTIGLAWIGAPNYTSTLCNPQYGTGVDQVTYSAAASAATLAHEMGHNYGALHDGDDPDDDAGLPGNACPSSGYILNAFTNLGSPPTQFSSCSLSYFSTYLAHHSASCLATRPDEIFENGFE